MKGQTNEQVLKPRLQRRLRKNLTDAEQREEDAVRTKSLTVAGFKVLRFWNNDVLRDIKAVKESIWLALQERCAPSPSQPSP